MSSVSVPESAREAVVTPLTPTEVQFLNLIAEDTSNKQIAAILGVSEQEIKKCVGAILRKLNASDRAHAVMLSLCNNWLSLQEVETSSQAELLTTEPAVAEAQRPAKRKTNGSSKAKRRGSETTDQPAVLTRGSKTAR
jgi:DNA-binding CsgD family transcriptional regulator